MANVKWIKLNVGMFDDEKIKLIEKMPDADTILVIWFKLLAQTGKQNAGGYIFLSERIPYTDEMLATIFDRPLNTVRMALQTFEKFGMLDIDDNGFIKISNWEKHQNVEGMDKIREQNRIRKQRERERKKLEIGEGQTKMSRDSHATVTDIEIELDKELDIDKDKEKKKEIYKVIVEFLNQKTGSKYRYSSKKTKQLINARLNEGFTVDDFKTVISIKTHEWLKNSEMVQYLRPETLFGTKFESYLNQKIKGMAPQPQKTNGSNQMYSPELQKAIMEMKQQGHSMAEIRKVLGI